MSLNYGSQLKNSSSVDTQVVDDSWILDSGASRHMPNNRDWYSSWHERFGHLNVVMLKEMKKSNMVVGLPTLSDLSHV